MCQKKKLKITEDNFQQPIPNLSSNSQSEIRCFVPSITANARILVFMMHLIKIFFNQIWDIFRHMSQIFSLISKSNWKVCLMAERKLIWRITCFRGKWRWRLQVPIFCTIDCKRAERKGKQFNNKYSHNNDKLSIDGSLWTTNFI